MFFSYSYVFLITIPTKLLIISKMPASLMLNTPLNLLSASNAPIIVPYLSFNGTASTVFVFI